MKLMLIDASPYIFRAFYSLPTSMKDRDGNPVNAVYGFTNTLCQMLTQSKIAHAAIAFDLSLTTSFRNDFYPDYKQQRELPPPELEAQMQRCREIASALGLAVFADQRYEADDLLGTILAQLRSFDVRALIVTSDKDMAQLIQKGDLLWDFARDRLLDERGVQEHFGVRPDQIIDYLALMGDSVDNIPGVPGVGTKTATALLKAFDTLDALYDRLDEIATLGLRGARRIRQNLVENKELAYLSQRLATIALDAPVSVTPRDVLWQQPDSEKLQDLLEQLRFGANIRKQIAGVELVYQQLQDEQKERGNDAG